MGASCRFRWPLSCDLVGVTPVLGVVDMGRLMTLGNVEVES